MLILFFSLLIIDFFAVDYLVDFTMLLSFNSVLGLNFVHVIVGLDILTTAIALCLNYVKFMVNMVEIFSE